MTHVTQILTCILNSTKSHIKRTVLCSKTNKMCYSSDPRKTQEYNYGLSGKGKTNKHR